MLITWLPVSLKSTNGPFLNTNCKPNPKKPGHVCTNYTKKTGWNVVQTHALVPKNFKMADGKVLNLTAIVSAYQISCTLLSSIELSDLSCSPLCLLHDCRSPASATPGPPRPAARTSTRPPAVCARRALALSPRGIRRSPQCRFGPMCGWASVPASRRRNARPS